MWRRGGCGLRNTRTPRTEVRGCVMVQPTPAGCARLRNTTDEVRGCVMVQPTPAGCVPLPHTTDGKPWVRYCPALTRGPPPPPQNPRPGDLTRGLGVRLTVSFLSARRGP